jgi:hypothetical protein
MQLMKGGQEMRVFVPTRGIEAIEKMAMWATWQEVDPSEVAKRFVELPEGCKTARRRYVKPGIIIRVTVGEENLYYILEHGDADFPEGKAVPWGQ